MSPLRSKPVAALLLFAFVLACVGPHLVHGMQRPGSGAAQPEADERDTGDAHGRPKSEADEVRNAPAVRKLAHLTGLSRENAYWLSIILNFAILSVFLGYLLRKNLPGMFRARNQAIEKRIEEARNMSAEARRRLKEVEDRLGRLDVEIGALRRTAEENAQAEQQRWIAEAEQERRHIVSAAEQEIAAMAGNARRELKAYAAELAAERAARKIKVDEDIDQSLVREFTMQLGKDGQ